MAKNPEIVTVPMIDPGEVADDAANITRKVGRAAQQTDVQTGRAGTAAFVQDIMTGGLSATNPEAFRAIQLFSANPKNKVSGKMLAQQGNLEREQSRLQALLDGGVNKNGRPLTGAQIKRIQSKLNKTTKRLTSLNTDISARQQRVQDFTQRQTTGGPKVNEVMREADPEFYANVDRAQGFANQIGTTSPEAQRFLDASGQGYQAGTIGAQSVTAAQMGPIANVGAQQVQAARMGDFGRAASRDITAGQVGAGMLGQSLMQRAMSGIERGGLLSQQATRDAIQSARQGFAARGMATGNAALGAELLNRDRYARQREFQDLGFAQGVQGQELGRQFQNVGNQLAADQANQSAAMQAELANLQARYNAAVQNGNWEQAAAISNQDATLRADMANQQTAFNTGQFNTQQANMVGISNADRTLTAATANENARRLGTVTNNEMLYNAAGYVDGQRSAGLGASLQMAGVQQAANPLFRVLGSNPYAGGYGTQAMGVGAQMAGGVAQLNAGANEFNANAANWGNYANAFQPSFQSGGGMEFNMGGAATGALSGAASGAMIGSVVPGIGTAVGAIGGGLIGGLGGGLSDKREKTDIKPLGSLSNVLKIPAYEYRYKGEKKKRKGVMAQDVAKVLPEAVTEVDYKGKKRLAIYPQVIGAALAQELTNQTKAVAA